MKSVKAPVCALAQKGHSKSENSTIETSAFLSPKIGSSSVILTLTFEGEGASATWFPDGAWTTLFPPPATKTTTRAIAKTKNPTFHKSSFFIVIVSFFSYDIIIY